MGGHTIGSRVTMLGGRLPCRVDGSRQRGAILLICFPLDVQKRINLSFLSTAAPGTLAKLKKKKSTLDLFCVNIMIMCGVRILNIKISHLVLLRLSCFGHYKEPRVVSETIFPALGSLCLHKVIIV